MCPADLLVPIRVLGQVLRVDNELVGWDAVAVTAESDGAVQGAGSHVADDVRVLRSLTELGGDIISGAVRNSDVVTDDATDGDVTNCRRKDCQSKVVDLNNNNTG